MKGILKTSTGYRAYVKVGPVQRERRYPPTATPKQMQAWRDEVRVSLRKLAPDTEPADTFAADVTRYLLQVTAMPTYDERTRHLELWLAALGPDTPRRQITAAAIREVLQTWRATLDPATCNKRRTALMHLWSVLDGKGASNPVRDVPKFRTADPLPRGRDPHVLDTALRAAPSCRSRACCRVLLWTGMRPDELARANPDDVDQARKIAIIKTGKGGRTRVIPLTPQALSAWQEFDRLACWHHVPQAAPLGRWLKAHTGIADLRVYDLRHTYGTALARQDTRLDVIAALMGHSTLELTRRYTLAAVSSGALAATVRLGQRPQKAGKKLARAATGRK